MCGSISRTPRVQPVTSSTSRARPKRCSSAGTSITERAHPAGQAHALVADAVAVLQAQGAAREIHLDPGAELAEDSRAASCTSVMSGTRCSVTGSRVSSVAQSTGSTAFLLAEGETRPRRGGRRGR